ncbi:NADPH-dependent FMN reductase [Actinomadura rugatobispora]|uniref:NADPH-dependent FMN reductase n=1 Tax=Actinomadura rugatobispora TaxID=1994 RepID=A0ABW1AC78_9ACTN|nr:NAD(P)H-dependent oxidoreductase [Actinomadura rugatobispora]
MRDTPFLVGLGGTLRAQSSSESALRIVLEHAQSLGATARQFSGEDLASLPPYAPERPDRTVLATELVAALRLADGVVIASPGYHGSVSGLLKNTLDYIEDMRTDARPYLSGRAVGMVSTAYGWQAAVTTLTSMRAIVHALRAWPTPFGAAINSAQVRIGPDGCSDDDVTSRLRTVAEEVVTFAVRQRAWANGTAHDGPAVREDPQPSGSRSDQGAV